jgi:Family of unknown function (DUF6290)
MEASDKEWAMSIEREEEIEARLTAEEARGQVVEGSGERIAGRRLPQVISLRLDGELLSALRAYASDKNMSLSDVIRSAAAKFLEEQAAVPVLVQLRQVVQEGGVYNQDWEESRTSAAIRPMKAATG